MSDPKVGDLIELVARLKRDGQPTRGLMTATVTSRAGTRTYAPGAGLKEQADGAYLLAYRCEEPGPIVIRFEGGGAFYEVKRTVVPAELAAAATLARAVQPPSESFEPTSDRSDREQNLAYLREHGVEVDDSRSDAWVRGAVRAMRGQSRDDYSRRQRDAWKPR